MSEVQSADSADASAARTAGEGDERRKEADSNEDADGTSRAEDGARERSLESDGITRRPTVVASTVALAAVALALVIVASASLTGGGVVLAGGLALAWGLIGPVPGSRRWLVDAGSLAAFAGVVVSGLEGALVEPTLVATVCAVVAWDLAGSAIDLGDQLGREADTRRLEGVHAVSSVLVGLATMAIGYGTFVSAADGQPVAAVALLLLAGTLATIALGIRRSWRG
ncbi:hypothetical protein [Natrialba sp. INN-245]|uniref:DUF7519 family protein n=1 Tax=Natrialba sp. INN-245 TaxID=2690967 RepID=UPI00190F5E04|nr:hypothetical protein [Natrialba sp. INN-245]